MITGLISFLFGLLVYFAPTIVSYYRNTLSTSLVIVNVLVGWTGIGWLACLIWSFVRKES